MHSDPELVQEVMARLKGNFRNIRDLRYTVTVEFDKDHREDDATKEVYLKLPEKCDDPAIRTSGPEAVWFQRLGGKLRIDLHSHNGLTRSTLDGGVLVSLFEGGGRKILSGIRPEDMSDRSEAFDSVFFHRYTLSDKRKEASDFYILSNERGTLWVSKEYFRPSKVEARDPYGATVVVQEFLDFHEFPELGFSFPRTIRTSHFPSGAVSESRIADLRINQGLRNDVFLIESAPRGPEPPRVEPLQDPDPELTAKLLDRLRGNYANIRDLQYTVEMEGRDPRNKGAKEVYVRFPIDASDGAGRSEEAVLGGHRESGIKVRTDVHMDWEGTVQDGEWVVCPVTHHMTFVDGLHLTLFQLFGQQVLGGVRQEEALGRLEGFDSIFFFDYVSAGSDGEKGDSYLLRGHSGTLSVDGETFRPAKVVAYYPDGVVNLEQEFAGFHEFPELGFSFPETVKTTYVTSWYHRNRPPETVSFHIDDVRVNQGLEDEFFRDMSRPAPEFQDRNVHDEIARLDRGKATLSNFSEILGDPRKHTKGKAVLSEDSLPPEYTVVFQHGVNVGIRDGSIEEVRFYVPGYSFREEIEVGSPLERVLEVVGQPERVIRGKPDGRTDGVLYKDIEGRKGYGCYERTDQNVEFFFMDGRVFRLTLTNWGGRRS